MRVFGSGGASAFLLSMRHLRHVNGLVLGSHNTRESQATDVRVRGSEAVSIEKRQEIKKTPKPISADVSQFWEGNDGPWSSFVLQIGNASQEVRVLPSTASTSTWVVIKDPYCDNIPIANCGDSRGKTFQKAASWTYKPVDIGQTSIFELGVEENLLGRMVYGDFGTDVMTLGWPGSGGVTVEKSIIAGIGDTHFTWLGVIGLNPRPTNFSSANDAPQTSFIQSLKNQGDIPSLSWAYTAGAQYMLDSVFGSLVFGGYDSARFTIPEKTTPGLTFRFHEDIARDLLVGVTSITTSKTIGSSSESQFLEEGIFAFVDSTVPHIWLPASVCKSFEDAFGLTWDETKELYTLSGKQHSTLLDLNPSITFTLSPSLTPASEEMTVSIVLPYSAFDLNVSWPFGGGQYSNESTYYFPLKRATNSSQHTLGRTFLQEAYLIADYERNNFSIWPAKWDDTTKTEELVSISPLTPVDAGLSDGASKKGLGTGVIAGIAVGGAAAVIICALVIFFFVRRRRRVREDETELQRAQTDTSRGSLPDYQQQHRASSEASPTTELGGNEKHELHEDHRFEAPDGGKFEMDGEGIPHEADGVEKKGLYEMDAGGDGIGGMHGVSITVEPPTALSPRPESVMPSPISEQSTLDSVAVEKAEHARAEKQNVAANTDEHDGVRSFFGFIKAFRRSGKS